jgi:hypothetical protein
MRWVLWVIFSEEAFKKTEDCRQMPGLAELASLYADHDVADASGG